MTTFRRKLYSWRHHILETPEKALGPAFPDRLHKNQLSLAIIIPLSAGEAAPRDWASLAPAVLVLPPGIEAAKLVTLVCELCRLLCAGYRLLTAISNAWERTDPSSVRPDLYVREDPEAIWPAPAQRPEAAGRRQAPAPQPSPPSNMPFVNIQHANIVEGDQININRSSRLT